MLYISMDTNSDFGCPDLQVGGNKSSHAFAPRKQVFKQAFSLARSRTTAGQHACHCVEPNFVALKKSAVDTILLYVTYPRAKARGYFLKDKRNMI